MHSKALLISCILILNNEPTPKQNYIHQTVYCRQYDSNVCHNKKWILASLSTHNLWPKFKFQYS